MAIRISDTDVLVTRDTPAGRVQTIEPHPRYVAERARVDALEAQRDRDELARERNREWWDE